MTREEEVKEEISLKNVLSISEERVLTSVQRAEAATGDARAVLEDHGHVPAARRGQQHHDLAPLNGREWETQVEKKRDEIVEQVLPCPRPAGTV